MATLAEAGAGLGLAGDAMPRLRTVERELAWYSRNRGMDGSIRVIVLGVAMYLLGAAKPPWNTTLAFALATVAIAWPRKK